MGRGRGRGGEAEEGVKTLMTLNGINRFYTT